MTNKNRDEAHLCPLDYFSSQLKHKPCSQRRAIFDGVSLLKGIDEARGLLGEGSSVEPVEYEVKEEGVCLTLVPGDAEEGGLLV